ncbi:hypothetical protein ALQ30_200223 [Pseudomonas syringae pv. persicae]|uniref:Uncharacterized protein n=1 Tax=Pseudomonas syringae pv. persicae TaxID=237306 RepID=A0A3M4A0U0_9PSED|nr:hypothetical protein ALQ30_200223 [Pseudomonas syringae pv. persicae]
MIRAIGIETAVQGELVAGFLVVGTEVLHKQLDQRHRVHWLPGMLPAGKGARAAAGATETMPVHLVRVEHPLRVLKHDPGGCVVSQIVQVGIIENKLPRAFTQQLLISFRCCRGLG